MTPLVREAVPAPCVSPAQTSSNDSSRHCGLVRRRQKASKESRTLGSEWHVVLDSRLLFLTCVVWRSPWLWVGLLQVPGGSGADDAVFSRLMMQKAGTQGKAVVSSRPFAYLCSRRLSLSHYFSILPAAHTLSFQEDLGPLYAPFNTTRGSNNGAHHPLDTRTPHDLHPCSALVHPQPSQPSQQQQASALPNPHNLHLHPRRLRNPPSRPNRHRNSPLLPYRHRSTPPHWRLHAQAMGSRPTHANPYGNRHSHLPSPDRLFTRSSLAIRIQRQTTSFQAVHRRRQERELPSSLSCR